MNDSKNSPLGLLTATLILLWTLLLIGGYFWAHKPFDVALLAGLQRTLVSIGVWLLVTAVAAALGLVLAGRWLADEWHFSRLALATGVGLGVVSLLTYLLGLLGLFNRPVAWLFLLLLALLALPGWRVFLRDVRMLGVPRPENRQQRWFLLFALLILGMTLVAALAPPTKWDAQVYHLTGPRLYIAAGRIIHPFDLPYLGFPALGQMQFTLGMLLAGDGVPALFHFGYGVLALAVVVALTRRAFSETAAWFAAVILLSVPALPSLTSAAYVDATLLFYATAAFYAFYRWRGDYLAGRAGWGWLVLLGAFCGFCGGVKYTAVAIPFALALCIAWLSWRDGLMALAGRLALVAGIALLLVLPWLLGNWTIRGNPFYPFFAEQGLYWDAWRHWWFDRPGTGFASTAPWRLLTAPLEATILGTEGSNFYDATIGPLVLLSVGLLLVVWRRLGAEERRTAGYLLLFTAVNYALWLVGLARSALLLQSRLLLPVFGVLAVLGGLALSRVVLLRARQLELGWVVRGLVNLALLFLLLTQLFTFIEHNPVPVVAGFESRSAYLQRRLGNYQLMIERVNELPAGSRVLFLWEPRSYECQVECRPDTLLDRWLHSTHYEGLEADDIVARWRAQGITHVALYQQGLDFLVNQGIDPITPADLENLEQVQTQHLEEIQRWGNTHILYQLSE